MKDVIISVGTHLFATKAFQVIYGTGCLTRSSRLNADPFPRGRDPRSHRNPDRCKSAADASEERAQMDRKHAVLDTLVAIVVEYCGKGVIGTGKMP